MRVIVRVRPLNRKEIADGHEEVVRVDESASAIHIRDPDLSERDPPKTFTFDAVFGST